MEVLLLSDPFMQRHSQGQGHPERPERLQAIARELEQSGWTIRQTETRPVSRHVIERIHLPGYIDVIDSLRGRSVQLDADTATSPESVDAAYVAVSTALQATVAVCQRAADAAIALVRPPGHHAEADRAMGFCFFNNIAIAAAYARAELGCERVLIIDWDVHHGNGTQHVFEDRRDILVINMHEWPQYPGTGSAHEVGVDDGEGFTVNIPLPAGCGDGDYLAAFQQIVVPIADSFRPQLVLVSAGFDAHEADPLGGMLVTQQGFAAMCGLAKQIASRHSGGRIALVLEGGYDLDGLARSVRACAEVLGGTAPGALSANAGVGSDAIAAAAGIQRRYWPT